MTLAGGEAKVERGEDVEVILEVQTPYAIELPSVVGVLQTHTSTARPLVR